MSDFWRQQYLEIKDSALLRWFGFFLSLTHIWTFLYWNQYSFFVSSQSGRNPEAVCFPFFPNCDLLRAALSTESWQAILLTYLFVAIISTCLFLRKQTLDWAYIFLFILSAMKLFFHLSNYAFMGNYHYMAHLVTFAYLLLPHKKVVIKILIILFYVAAGALKINIEWLSGAAMINTPFIIGHLLTISLFYVLFLELIFVWGLIHPNRWVRRLTLAQFFAFHIFSWHIVGFFYPLVMFCLLSIFWLEEIPQLRDEKSSALLVPFFSLQLPRLTYFIVLLFGLLQISPFLFIRDPALSGAFRLASLNMFDAKTECQTLLIANGEQGQAHINPPTKNRGVRLGCDPIIYLNQAKTICRRAQANNQPITLHLALFSKRVTDLDYTKVLDIKDICRLKNPLWAEGEDR